MSAVDEEALRQYSYSAAMDATSRLFACCDTKWPQFYLQTGINHLIDDLLQTSLHLRRLSEFKHKKIDRKIVPRDFGVKRKFDGFESDFWTAMNRIIHHKKLDPIVFTQPDFYSSGPSPMPGHLVADVRIESDRGVSMVNVAGFAIAATNELGELSIVPQKVMH
jgi:hypothetical protein